MILKSASSTQFVNETIDHPEPTPYNARLIESAETRKGLRMVDLVYIGK